MHRCSILKNVTTQKQRENMMFTYFPRTTVDGVYSVGMKHVRGGIVSVDPYGERNQGGFETARC